MMQSKSITLIVAVAGAVMVICAAAFFLINGGDGNGGGSDTYTDARGREVAVSDTDRILAVNCCSLELLSYFDSVDRIVAYDQDEKRNGNLTYTQVLSEKLDSIKPVDRRNDEAVMALNPSIVITSTTQVAELDNMQSTWGVPVYAVNADLEFGDDKWFDQIISLGEVLGEEKRAKDIVSGVRGIIRDITDHKLAVERTGYAGGMTFYGKQGFLMTSGDGDFLPFAYSGVKNLFPHGTDGVGGQPYLVDEEKVLPENNKFDYIFVDGLTAVKSRDAMNDLIDRTDFEEQPAVANGDIYKTLTYKMWGTQFDAVLINCLYVAKTVNPDGYGWDFEDKADEVLDLLYGKDSKMAYGDIAAKQDGGCGRITL